MEDVYQVGTASTRAWYRLKRLPCCWHGAVVTERAARPLRCCCRPQIMLPRMRYAKAQGCDAVEMVSEAGLTSGAAPRELALPCGSRPAMEPGPP